jgi:peptide chain release factor subunit 1
MSAQPAAGSRPVLNGRATLDRDAIDRLVHFRSPKAPVLSVYVAVPADPGEIAMQTRLRSLLKPVKELADSDQLEHYPRLSLRTDLDRVFELATRGTELQGRSVAVFACHQEGLFEEIELARTVRDRVEVDLTPYLRPLLAVLEASRRWCAVVVDRSRAWLYTGATDELDDAGKLEASLLQDRKRAEWHGEREDTANNRERTLARRHFRQTAQRVERLVNEQDVELLVVGGHEETVAEFLPFLPKRLHARIAGTFVVDTRTMTPAQVREQSTQVVEAYERTEQIRLVDEALEAVAAGGLAAAGLEWCLNAVNERAVQLLLVDGDDQEPGRVSDRCGWIGLQGDECTVCGEPTRPTPDVIDEMAAAVIDASGNVEHVRPGTALEQHGVAAFLRFPVPRTVPA